MPGTVGISKWRKDGNTDLLPWQDASGDWDNCLIGGKNNQVVVAAKNNSVATRQFGLYVEPGESAGPRVEPVVSKGYYNQAIALTNYAVGDWVPADFGVVRPGNPLVLDYVHYQIEIGETLFLVPNSIHRLNIDYTHNPVGGIVRVTFDTVANMQVASVALPFAADLFYHPRYQQLLFPAAP